ncbi:MAG: hypothetical protein NUV56_01890 [Candidatus Uhrbacteria bacterium]|nr:hypothetical protein [Candidatus Uhrbacteria bacterium]
MGGLFGGSSPEAASGTVTTSEVPSPNEMPPMVEPQAAPEVAPIEQGQEQPHM